MDTLDTTKKNITTLIKNYFNEINNFSFDAKNPKIRLHEATFGPDEIMAALDCMLTTQVTMGPKVRKFEKEFTNYFNFRYGVMSNSGSSANLLAISALSNPALENYLQPGDEVIVPALSWSTTVWPIIQCNLTPVIVDINPATLNIDPSAIEKAIGPKTRAVMIVPVYGNPCDMDKIVEICEAHNLILIEDCCEALGAYYDGKALGSFGKVGSFSFYFSHHINTFEGGITVTNDTAVSEMMRILRAHGWVREVDDKQAYLSKYPEFDPRFLFVNVGYNLRPTELQGAIGSVQLPKLKSFVEIRRENAHALKKELEEYRDLLIPQEETNKGYHSWFGFPLTLTPKAAFSVNEIRAYLESEGIETRPIICGNIAAQPAMKLYKHKVEGNLNHANNVMHRSFSFGNHQYINEEARSYIVGRVKKFLDKVCIK